MATLYLDFAGGNDSNDGTSFANRVKTPDGGITAVRSAPGDTIRIMKTPDPTLVGNATWTRASQTVTLGSAVTANICTCESNWTASANVTCTSSSTLSREGTNHQRFSIASGFTTGKAGYFATGALNLSAYEQVSFWILCSATLVAGRAELRLCSDTTGDTVVDTVPIPVLNSNSEWIPVTWNKGSALGSSIQSISLYFNSDPGTASIYLDNVIACKATSAADSLTLTSLMAPASALRWQPSTSYAAGTIRCPTIANRTGFRYLKTSSGTQTSGSTEPTWPTIYGQTVSDGSITWRCDGPEDSWTPILWINGTSVGVREGGSGAGNPWFGYNGDSSSFQMYKREGYIWGVTTSVFQGNENGTATAPVSWEGGYDTTSMSSVDGETWLILNHIANGLYPLRDYHRYKNIHFACPLIGIVDYAANGCEFDRMSVVDPDTMGAQASAGTSNSTVSRFRACVFSGSGANEAQAVKQWEFTHCGFVGGGVSASAGRSRVYVNECQFSIGYGTIAGCGPGSLVVLNRCYAKHVTYDAADGYLGYTSYTTYGQIVFNDCDYDFEIPDAQPGLHGGSMVWPNFIFHHNYAGNVGDHRIYQQSGYGVVRSATDYRHTGVGLAWKFLVHVNGTMNPVVLPLGKILCEANVSRTVRIWCRRSAATITGKLFIPAYSIAGINAEPSVALSPSATNTWEQSGSLTFTPTATGVVELWVHVWDPTAYGTVMWIDDLTVT